MDYLTPDSHVPKSIRALLYYAQRYGDTKAGAVPGAKEDNTLPGLDKVDGTLFVRVAGKTMDYMGWTKEATRRETGTAVLWDGTELGSWKAAGRRMRGIFSEYYSCMLEM